MQNGAMFIAHRFLLACAIGDSSHTSHKCKRVRCITHDSPNNIVCDLGTHRTQFRRNEQCVLFRTQFTIMAELRLMVPSHMHLSLQSCVTYTTWFTEMNRVCYLAPSQRVLLKKLLVTLLTRLQKIKRVATPSSPARMLTSSRPRRTSIDSRASPHRVPAEHASVPVCMPASWPPSAL